MKIFLLGVLAIILLGVIGFVLSLDKTPQEENNQPVEQPIEQEQVMTPNELKIEDTVVGEGTEAVAGKIVVVHYTGTLVNGTTFDSSLDRGTPFQFILGTGQVILGWEQGIAGMKVGGKRTLTIPPKLAYGASAGHALQNETLIFQVELLDVKEQ